MSTAMPPKSHDYRLAETHRELVNQVVTEPAMRSGTPDERVRRATDAVRERRMMERTIETSGMTSADKRAALAQLARLRREGATF